jgi:stress response protein YsnF
VVDTVEELARAELRGEKVDVTRVPVDREIDRAPEIRTENGVTVIPIVEEILVVEKRLVLKEELHVRRQETTEIVEVPVTVRRQRAVVERVTPDGDTRAEEIE